MQDDLRVFSSDITRAHKPLRNNLYDLINVVPAIPTKECREKEKECNFEPRNDKYYIPKKKYRTKVRTVRDIRNSFEKEVNSYLPTELEMQQNVLLRKITGGSSREENTRTLAKNILRCDKPVTRSAWQMLMNLNPEKQTHSVQYVLWKGKCIRVNGSKGGKTKFLCNYDLVSTEPKYKRKSLLQKKTSKKKIGLLQNSLTVKFKPGPLTKKEQLDDSYQKYNFGGIELANLPRPGLEIQPAYGVVLEPTISKFVESLRGNNGVISAKWAEFTVSVLGTVNNADIVQNNQCGVTFDLNYKYDQRRILMRRDVDKFTKIQNNENTILHCCSTSEESVIAQEVSAIVSKMLDSVEISLLQDKLFTGEEEPREILDCNAIKTTVQTKDKVKKKYNAELSRLDVTIIRLPEVSHEQKVDGCLNDFCSLGCICGSLQCQYNLKQHCGHVECMFECKCDFSKFKATDSFDSDCSELIPGLLNLDKEINSRLSKEEQKFHQTVVMTGEKSIVLKSERRNWKASKRYADFYNHMSLKTESKTKKVLSVIDVKLNCENIEPWCMVHNLYKCFCKGKFTDSLLSDTAFNEIVNTETTITEAEMNEVETVVNDNNGTIARMASKRRMKEERIDVGKKSKSLSVSECSDTTDVDSIWYKHSCARLRPYMGRKYNDSYYLSTNKKIFEMEKNDSKLYNKMMSIVNKNDNITEDHDLMLESNNIVSQKRANDSDINDNCNSLNKNTGKSLIHQLLTNNDNIKSKILALDTVSEPSINAVHKKPTTSSSAVTSNDTRSILKPVIKAASQPIPNKAKLIAWLESSYKLYKYRMDQGIVKSSLDPPKHGKVALYPWDFILKRYRERKNLFLISNQKPYRMFMAIDTKNNFFENCINIDDIRFADLSKYPITVRNLLINDTEMNDNFCILCGLSHCWELIGSVTKVKEKKENGEEVDNFVDTDNNSLQDTLPRASDIEIDVRDIQENMNENEFNIDSSKWFVMTVENDFTEIQFHQKGFFVKYESIIKAINVARMSGKTVRLSSQKCVDQNSDPQFGIYAIPNANEYSVFVGPYDKDDPLGIETVKTVSDIGKLKRTRGVWITTKKVDNVKVIDNPLLFMPPNNIHPRMIISLEDDFKSKEINETMDEHSSQKITNSHEKPESISQEHKSKLVKPIKIRRTNGFYHLAPKNFLNQVSSQQETQTPGPIASKFSKQFCFSKSLLEDPNTGSSNAKPLLLNNLLNTNMTDFRPLLNHPSSLLKNLSKTGDSFPKLKPLLTVENKRPVAEIAPQVKIVGIYSESGVLLDDKLESKQPERGMFVLKPEEINKRLMENKIKSDANLISSNSDIECSYVEGLNQDIENFLATTVARTSTDIYVISDEEDCNNDLITDLKNWKEVWIESKNIDTLGLIRGKRNADNELSFEFPGFKYTEFYKEEEAFSKITQVMKRKIFVPKNINLEWHVIDSIEDAKTKHMLKSEELGIDFVLTKRGLRHKRDLMAHSKSVCKSNVKTQKINTKFSEHDVEKASDLMSQLEEQSRTLDEESFLLMKEFTKRSESLNSIPSVSDDQRDQMAETLQNIISVSRKEKSSSE